MSARFVITGGMPEPGTLPRRILVKASGIHRLVNFGGGDLGDFAGVEVSARMSNFPDEEMWSLWLGDGRRMDFTELPANWTITPTPGDWPESARPRLLKGEFYD